MSKFIKVTALGSDDLSTAESVTVGMRLMANGLRFFYIEEGVLYASSKAIPFYRELMEAINAIVRDETTDNVPDTVATIDYKNYKIYETGTDVVYLVTPYDDLL